MKSILHEKDGTCYLCMKLHNNLNRYGYTEEHHVFGGNPNRKLSEKYGLKVHLCIWHHRTGPESVHQNQTVARMLKQIAQRKFEETHTREEFMEIFGRNWMDDESMDDM